MLHFNKQYQERYCSTILYSIYANRTTRQEKVLQDQSIAVISLYSLLGLCYMSAGFNRTHMPLNTQVMWQVK